MISTELKKTLVHLSEEEKEEVLDVFVSIYGVDRLRTWMYGKGKSGGPTYWQCPNGHRLLNRGREPGPCPYCNEPLRAAVNAKNRIRTGFGIYFRDDPWAADANRQLLAYARERGIKQTWMREYEDLLS